MEENEKRERLNKRQNKKIKECQNWHRNTLADLDPYELLEEYIDAKYDGKIKVPRAIEKIAAEIERLMERIQVGNN